MNSLKALVNPDGSIIGTTRDPLVAGTPVPAEVSEEQLADYIVVDGEFIQNLELAVARAKSLRVSVIKSEAATRIAATDWKLERAKERESAGWATLGEVDDVLTEREAIRRSSNEAEVALLALTELPDIQGFTWEVTAVVANPKRYTHDKFIGLFTDAEITAIRAEPLLLNWWTRFTFVDFVSLSDPDTATGIQALSVLGVIAADRVPTILAGEKP